MRWLLPIGGALALVALVLWAAFRPSPPGNAPAASIPEANASTTISAAPVQIQDRLTDSFKSVTSSLASVTDAASAAAAVPKLKDIGDKLDAIKPAMDKLPDAGKAKVKEMIQSDLASIDDRFAKLLWIPGIGDNLKQAVDPIMDRFASLGGLQVPRTANVSGELAGIVSALTGTLSGIKDATSAEAALPKLRELDNRLDASKDMMAGLPSSGKSTVNTLLKVATTNLKRLVDKVVATTGVGDSVKPVVDSIMAKLNALTA
jgi:hypothetical protein